MKKNLRQTSHDTVAICITVSFFFAVLMSLKASETYTNWGWASLRLVVQKTNLFMGDKILVSAVASNVLENEHILWQYAGDPCLCGPGKILIVEMSSGKEIKCRFSLDERAGWADYYSISLQGHKSKSFEVDLQKGYAITNTGFYSVQAVGWFPINEPPTNHQHATVVTPPIVINLLPKSETNAPPK
jgi:hypothetical protein